MEEPSAIQQASRLAESLGVGRVGVLLKTGVILTVFKRLSNKRKISSSESAEKRTAEEKYERFVYNIQIMESCA